jgi:hypothetical protein
VRGSQIPRVWAQRTPAVLLQLLSAQVDSVDPQAAPEVGDVEFTGVENEHLGWRRKRLRGARTPPLELGTAANAASGPHGSGGRRWCATGREVAKEMASGCGGAAATGDVCDQGIERKRRPGCAAVQDTGRVARLGRAGRRVGLDMDRVSPAQIQRKLVLINYSDALRFVQFF